MLHRIIAMNRRSWLYVLMEHCNVHFCITDPMTYVDMIKYWFVGKTVSAERHERSSVINRKGGCATTRNCHQRS
jgi:hypothetical protein